MTNRWTDGHRATAKTALTHSHFVVSFLCVLSFTCAVTAVSLCFVLCAASGVMLIASRGNKIDHGSMVVQSVLCMLKSVTTFVRGG